jgi:HEAT repeat protein
LVTHHICPSQNILSQWFTALDEESFEKKPDESLLPTYHALAALIVFTSSDHTQKYLQELFDNICVLLRNCEDHQLSQPTLDLLKQLAELKPTRCIRLLIDAYQEKKLSLTMLLNCCTTLSPVTLTKHAESLCHCLAQALLEKDPDAQRAALALMQTTPTLLTAVVNVLDGKETWYTNTLSVLAFACGQDNALKLVFDASTTDRICSMLLGYLRASDLTDCVAATKVLGQLAPVLIYHPNEANKVLTALITWPLDSKEGRPAIHWSVLDALGQMAPLLQQHPEKASRVLLVFFKGLEADDYKVIDAAIKGLGQLAHVLAADPQPIYRRVALTILLNCLHGSNLDLRHNAVKTLAQFAPVLQLHPEEASRVLTALLDTAYIDSTALVLTHRSDIPGIANADLNRTNNTHPDVVAYNTEIRVHLTPLLQLDPKLVPGVLNSLLKNLQDSNFDVSVAALSIVVQLHPERLLGIFTTLLNGLQKSNPDVCAAALSALIQLAPVLAQHPELVTNLVATLFNRFHDSNNIVRGNAINALAQLTRVWMLHPALVPEVLNRLLDSLQGPNGKVCDATISVFGELAPVLADYPEHANKVLTVLLNNVQNSDEMVRYYAVSGFEKLAPVLRQHPKHVLDVLNSLFKKLKDTDPSVCNAAARAFGQLVPELHQHLELVPDILSALVKNQYIKSGERQCAIETLERLLPSLKAEQQRVVQEFIKSHEGVAMLWPLAHVRKLCTTALTNATQYSYNCLLKTMHAVSKPPINIASWLLQPETQPLELRDAIAAARTAATITDVMADLTVCQTLRAGLPLIVRFINLGLYHPVKQLFEAAVRIQAAAPISAPKKEVQAEPKLSPTTTQPPLNRYYQYALMELLVANPTLATELKLNQQQLFTLISPVYLNKEISPDLSARIADWLAEQGFEQLPPPVIEHCLARAVACLQGTKPFIPNAIMRILASADLHNVIKQLMAQLQMVDSVTTAKEQAKEIKEINDAIKLAPLRLQCIPLINLMRCLATFPAPNTMTAEIATIISKKINAATLGDLRNVLNQLSIPTLLTCYQEQSKLLHQEQHALFIKILCEKLASEPFPIRANKIVVIADKEYLLPEELQTALTATPAQSLSASASTQAQDSTATELQPPPKSPTV